MQATGIIAEYNPFHRGHAYHISQTRSMGFERIVCVMSGNFPQRGDVAVASKWARAAMALQGGADLVIELPVTFALAPAERFARGGISLLQSLGCVEAVSFGSESGSLEPLKKAADLVDSGRLDHEIRRLLSGGLSYAAARQQAARDELGPAADIFSHPNDTLGVEYLRALSALSCDIRPLAIKRHGAGHDALKERDGIASASYLRSRWREQATPILDDLPDGCREILLSELTAGRFPVFLSKAEPILLGLLRAAQKDQYSRLPDCSEGLENRLWKAVRDGCSLDEIFHLAKTKRYPLARIRRLCLYLALGIAREDWMASPPYLRILGFGPGGIELLQKAKKTSQIPIVYGAGDVLALDSAARRCFEIECRATDLYTLAYPRPLPCGSDQRHKLVVLK